MRGQTLLQRCCVDSLSLPAQCFCAKLFHEINSSLACALRVEQPRVIINVVSSKLRGKFICIACNIRQTYTYIIPFDVLIVTGNSHA